MTPEVVVVGGGFAGLSAAAALAGAGRRVLVLDARPHLGGRATAFRDRETGELVDNGQHVLFGCYRETLRFLARIGAEQNVHVQPVLRVPYIDVRGRRSQLSCPPLPAPLHLMAAVLDWDPIPWRERLAVLRLAAPLRTARQQLATRGRITAGPPGTTVSDWLRTHRQGRRLCEWLWEPLAIAALNQSPEEASAAAFVRILAEMFGPDPSASAIVLPTVPLNLMYAEPARRFIEQRGGEVRSGALARIMCNDGEVAAVQVRGESIASRVVIAAVPWFDLPALFTDDPPSPMEETIAAARGLESKPILTVNLWYDRAVMNEPFVGLPGRSIQWVFDKRAAFGGSASHLSLVASGAESLVRHDSAFVIERAAAEVAEALPAARAARLVRGTVIREKRATFSLAPGQPPRPGTRTAVRGLYLAGDWVDTGLPGTIESAVVSGHRAAAAVLED